MPEKLVFDRKSVFNPVGKEWADLSSGEKSMYRVIRAVAEAETGGYFDAFNAYDRVVSSLGLFHWSIAGVQNPHDGSRRVAGELVGYLAYLRYAEALTYRMLTEDFGIWPYPSWGVNGADLFKLGFDKNEGDRLRKYCGYIQKLQYDEQFRPEWVRVDKNEDLDYLRTWHWVYRFIMATRTSAAFRSRMWDMARIRLRDIQGTAFPNVNWATTMGDIFTSERSMALLLRWHVLSPIDIVRFNKASPELKEQVVDKVTVSHTESNFQKELAKKLFSYLDPKISGSGVDKAYNWTDPDGQALSFGNGSFSFDYSDLPHTPD